MSMSSHYSLLSPLAIYLASSPELLTRSPLSAQALGIFWGCLLSHITWQYAPPTLRQKDVNPSCSCLDNNVLCSYFEQ